MLASICCSYKEAAIQLENEGYEIDENGIWVGSGKTIKGNHGMDICTSDNCVALITQIDDRGRIIIIYTNKEGLNY
jgi:hypothetical protein